MIREIEVLSRKLCLLGGAKFFPQYLQKYLYRQNSCAAGWALRVELIRMTRMKPTSGREKWETATRGKTEGMFMSSINRPRG